MRCIASHDGTALVWLGSRSAIGDRKGFVIEDEMVFDRRASSTLLEALGPAGVLAPLMTRRNGDPFRFDVQLRRDQKGTRSWASLYVGLTTILSVDEAAGSFKLRAHRTHQAAGEFPAAWSQWHSGNVLAASWPAVEEYLNKAEAAVPSRHVDAEGEVHSALCSATSDDYFVIQREASIAFRDQPTKDRICDALTAPIYAAIDVASVGQPWWPGVRDHGKHQRLGTSPDILAVDTSGRLLAIEAKPANALKGIVWGPAQVLLYAHLFATLLAAVTTAAHLLGEMLDQRVKLGLTHTGAPCLGAAPIVVPVLAIGHGTPSAVARERMSSVAKALEQVDSPPGVAPLEVWSLDRMGRCQERWA